MTTGISTRRLFNTLTIAALAAIGGVSALVPAVAQAKDITLLNVSYDPTRELYQEYNAAFAKYWKATLKPIAAPSGHALSHADLLADAC